MELGLKDVAQNHSSRFFHDSECVDLFLFYSDSLRISFAAHCYAIHYYFYYYSGD